MLLGLGALFVLFTYCVVWPIVKTVVNGACSPGSVLGTLLFLLYINDFSKCSNVSDFHIFADDTHLFYSNSYLAELESFVNHSLKMVSDWLIANKVSLNIDKTNFILFYPPQKVKCQGSPNQIKNI